MGHKPKMLFGLLACETLAWILFEQTDDEILDEGWKGSKVNALKGHILSCDVVDGITMVLFLEGSVASNQFIERNTDCPAVYLLRVASP